MASAKFANSTVNHSHSVICRLKAKLVPPATASRISSTLVITEPISTTNITGFFIMVRGFNLRKESSSARRTIFASHNVRFDLGLIDLRSEGLACAHQQVLQQWSQAERGEKCERAHNHNHSHQQHGKQWRGDRECAGRWRSNLLG